jgi:stage V sporulation protein B
VSGVISVLYLSTAVKIKGTGNKAKTDINKKQMLAMSVPVASSALVISLVNFFDTAVCMPVIKALPYKEIVQSFDGASFMGAEEISMYLFGIYQGMALTVFNLVPAVMASVGAACLPVLTKAQGFKDKTYLLRQTEKLYRIIAFLSVPVSVFIFSFRCEIVKFLFDTSEGQTVIAADLIAILIPFCVFSCFTSAFNSVINAYGKSHIAFKILVVASVVKCVLSIVLCSVPNINIRGFAVSSAVFYTIIFVMSAIYTGKLGVIFDPFKFLLIPLIVSVAVVLTIQCFIVPMVRYLPLFLRLGFTGVIFCTAYIIITWFAGFTVDIS